MMLEDVMKLQHNSKHLDYLYYNNVVYLDIGWPKD